MDMNVCVINYRNWPKLKKKKVTSIMKPFLCIRTVQRHTSQQSKIPIILREFMRAQPCGTKQKTK